MKKQKEKRGLKTKRQKERGITLIALVITIIVLLILAGVSISMLTGENGVLTKATQSQEETEIAQLKEQSELARQGVMSGDIAQGKTTNREDIINAIQKEVGGSVDGNLITTEDGKYEIMVKDDNTIEVVEKGQGYKDAEYSEPAPESDFRWTTLEDGTVRIFEYLGTEASLKIPDTIEGKTVTVIQNDNLTHGGPETIEGGNIAQGKTIKSLIIPDTVTRIAYRSFQNNNIEDLKLSNNLLRIESEAFMDNQIKNIKIPDKVTFIGDRAFMNNQATKIEIPKSVTDLEYGAFVQNNLDKIIYGRTSTGEEDKTVINSYAGRNAGDIIIPEGVREIAPFAFCDVGLTSIEISEGVTKIGLMSFRGDNLKRLIISSKINSCNIGSFDFKSIEYIEFKVNSFVNTFAAISCTGKINKIKVPYSADGSILEYYKGLISSNAIYVPGGVESIVDQ